MPDVTLYKNLTHYIENTNLGIIFTAHHLEFRATFEKQYHLWQITFRNNNDKIIEEAKSPNNKFYEPSFTDLVYEFCLCTKAFDLSRSEFEKIYSLKLNDDEHFRMRQRGKRFKDLNIDQNIIDNILSYNYNSRWTLV